MKRKNKILWIEILVLGLFFFLLFFLYGPISFFRSYLITTSMTTRSHQWIAKLIFSEKDIANAMNQNRVFEHQENTDLSKIKIQSSGSLYRVKKIYGAGYHGYLVEVFDPTRISLVTAEKWGVEGEYILDASKRNHAKVMINSVGFYDPNWSSNGAVAHGVVIQNGKVISNYGTSNVGGGFTGFTYDGKLFLGNVSTDAILSLGIKDAVQFGPYLIINGKASMVSGNGGFGVAPRTVIGQRRDGTVLLLVINGRIPSSIGVSMKELIDIMVKNGAYNAVNMDGGSSSSLIVNNKIMNRPVGGGKNGLRKLPLFWMVK